jgi:hypothetical protein
MSSRGIVAALLAAGLSGSAVAVAQAPTDTSRWDLTPPRVSYLTGEVSFWRPGVNDWAPGQLNTPLAPGDALHVGVDGAVEVQVGPGDFVRAAAGSQLGFDRQDAESVQFRVAVGYAAVDRHDLPRGHAVVLATPNAAAITIDQAGSYRIGVSAEATTVVAFAGGSARVTTADGRSVSVGPGQQVVLTGAESPAITISGAPAPSAWDRWSDQRAESIRVVASAPYVPPGVYGAEELDRHGTWSAVEPYGPLWIPTTVPAGWAPYTSGRWIWDPRYGWTWLDDAAWGWAPFHYGRWVFIRETWGWVPGPIVARPTYAPALVAFLDGPVVPARPVCWVALGWGEPVRPWWGGPGFAGRPWWGGWGGPRIVNNVVVNHTTVVTGRDVTVYRNTGVPNAVVAVPAERFGRDPVARARIDRIDAPRLTPARGPAPVRPVVARVAPADPRGPRDRDGLRPPARPATPPSTARSASRQAAEPGRPERLVPGRRAPALAAPPRAQAPAPPVRRPAPPPAVARPPAGNHPLRLENARLDRTPARAVPASPPASLSRPQPAAGRPGSTAPGHPAPGAVRPATRLEPAGPGRRSSAGERAGRVSRPVEARRSVADEQGRPGNGGRDVGRRPAGAAPDSKRRSGRNDGD